MYTISGKKSPKVGGVMVEEYGKKLPLRLIVADDESDPGKAAAAMERLIKVNKVIFSWADLHPDPRASFPVA